MGHLIRALAHPFLLALVVWDGWMHPDTHLHNTTWALILHVLHCGATADLTRRLLAPLSFIVSHGVLTGWLVFTYFNPELDTQEKVKAWGCSVQYGMCPALRLKPGLEAS
jgi:hypothetical protein